MKDSYKKKTRRKSKGMGRRTFGKKRKRDPPTERKRLGA